MTARFMLVMRQKSRTSFLKIHSFFEFFIFPITRTNTCFDLFMQTTLQCRYDSTMLVADAIKLPTP